MISPAGMLKNLIGDRGRVFTSKRWSSLCYIYSLLPPAGRWPASGTSQLLGPGMMYHRALTRYINLVLGIMASRSPINSRAILNINCTKPSSSTRSETSLIEASRVRWLIYRWYGGKNITPASFGVFWGAKNQSIGDWRVNSFNSTDQIRGFKRSARS
jgi:hypothetical protein